ncbi:hypothetical protein AB0425_28795 [Actinosynnema sp. NPDC051121]|nr:hypothetical protein [Saccharothrix sp.]
MPTGPAPAAPGSVAGSSTSGSPASGHVPTPIPGYGPTPPAPPGGSKTGPAVVVAIGLAVSGGSSIGAVTTSVPAAPSQVPATTTAPPSAPPGEYSMSAITNACDLLDPTPLLKWSSTPIPPVHGEHPPSGGCGGGLTCTLRYTSPSPIDGVTTDEAGIGVSVGSTAAGEPPEYDRWNTGTIPGLGARNHWRAIAVTDPVPGASYIVAVQDGNVSVEIQVAVRRARGDGPPALDDLSAIARSHARSVLDRLKRP